VVAGDVWAADQKLEELALVKAQHQVVLNVVCARNSLNFDETATFILIFTFGVFVEHVFSPQG